MVCFLRYSNVVWIFSMLPSLHSVLHSNLCVIYPLRLTMIAYPRALVFALAWWTIIYRVHGSRAVNQQSYGVRPVMWHGVSTIYLPAIDALAPMFGTATTVMMSTAVSSKHHVFSNIFGWVMITAPRLCSRQLYVQLARNIFHNGTNVSSIITSSI